MKHRSCYIAGPMRGLPEYNYPAFMDAATRLRQLGWMVFNPAEMDIESDHEDYTARTIEEQQLHDSAAVARRFAERDVHVLIRTLRAENRDAIIMLPGWRGSTGAIAELGVAQWVKLEVLPLKWALAMGDQSVV